MPKYNIYYYNTDWDFTEPFDTLVMEKQENLTLDELISHIEQDKDCEQNQLNLSDYLELIRKVKLLSDTGTQKIVTTINGTIYIIKVLDKKTL